MPRQDIITPGMDFSDFIDRRVQIVGPEVAGGSATYAADITADGSTDEVTLLASYFDDLPQGGTLLLPPGTIRVSQSIISEINGKSLTLKGAGRFSTFIKFTDDALSDPQSSSLLLFEDCTGVYIADLSFDSRNWQDGTNRESTGTLLTGATKTTFPLPSTASGTDIYDGGQFVIFEDIGNPFASYQDFVISGYNTGTKVITVSTPVRNYSINPSAVAAGPPGTFTMPVKYDGLTEEQLVGAVVVVTGGTGNGATEYVIDAYDEETRVVTIDQAWASSTPTTSSTLVIYYGIPSDEAKFGILLPDGSGNPQNTEGLGRLRFENCTDIFLDNVGFLGGHGGADFVGCSHIRGVGIYAEDVYENVFNLLLGDNQDIVILGSAFNGVGQGFDCSGKNFVFDGGYCILNGREADFCDLNTSQHGIISNWYIRNGGQTFVVHGTASDITDCTFDITISNIQHYDFEDNAISIQYGGSDATAQDALEGAVGNIQIDNCKFITTKPGSQGLTLSTQSISTSIYIDDINVQNTVVQTVGDACVCHKNRGLTLDTCTIHSSRGRAVYGNNVTHNATLYRPTRIKVKDCDLKGYANSNTTGGALYINGGVDIEVLRCDYETTGGDGHGLHFRLCQNVKAIGNTCITCPRTGIFFEVTSTAVSAGYVNSDLELNYTASENHFKDFGTAGNRYAIRLQCTVTTGTFKNFFTDQNVITLPSDSSSHSGIRTDFSSGSSLSFWFGRGNTMSEHLTNAATRWDIQGTGYAHPIVLEGNAPNYGPTVQALTGNLTVTQFMQNCAFSNAGASGTVQVALPAAKRGMRFGPFFVSAAQAFRLDPNGSEVIYGLDAAAGGAGKYIGASSVGHHLVVECPEDGYWITRGAGTWAAEP